MMVLIVAVNVLFAATTPGIMHIVFDNGEVVTSGSDTFFEFDILAYISNTVNEDDLKFGSATFYVQYDTTLFGSLIAGKTTLEYEKTGLLAGELFPGFQLYRLFQSNNTFPDVFSFTIEAVFTEPEYSNYYSSLSTDPLNPSELFHIRMKAKASGSGEVIFPDSRIAGSDGLFWSLENKQYAGPVDYSLAHESVYIEGPIPGDPYTSIELLSLEAEYKGGMVRMKWQTASETENRGFIIKRAVMLNEQETGIYEKIASYIEDRSLEGAGTTNRKNTYLYFNRSVRPGVTYSYVLQDVDYSGHIRESEPLIVHVPENKIAMSEQFALSASYPNPFNPSFVVPFELYASTVIDIRLYDMSGRLIQVVADREFMPGTYNLLVDGSHLASGVYLLTTRVENTVKTQKMLLVK